MALTLVPYLLGYIYQGARPALGWFSGFTFNATDHCVYLSWMKQAADGGFFQKNLFTTDPQTGHQFNLFYLTLGWLSKLSHLPPNIIYQSARFGLGLGFLRSIWWLLEMWVGDRRARWTAFLIVCFSAGLGWVPGLWEAGILKGPIDTWQPEAITFLSLYLFPLFIVSLLLMVGFIGNMYRASHSGKVKYAANAGICGLLLGNIHTYDVVTIWAVWTIYLVAQWISKKKIETQQVTQAFVAGIPTILTTGYTAYLLKSETVFRQRALVPTIWPAGSGG